MFERLEGRTSERINAKKSQQKIEKVDGGIDFQVDFLF